MIVGFAPKVGRCMVHVSCSGCVWALLKKEKKFGKLFFFFKRGENIVKGGGGSLGEGEIRMSFVLLSVMILKLEIFSF